MMHSKVERPLWRREQSQADLGQESLQNFEVQLQNNETLFHKENKDAHNTVGDKTVQLHKMSKRQYEWYRDPKLNPDNAHERRFEMLPYDGLPDVHSKNARLHNSVDMQKERGRQARIIELVANEVVQPVVKLQSDIQYEYDARKLQAPISKLATFTKRVRFDHNGIFGDLFDERKEDRFGRPRLSSLDQDKANIARD